MNDDIWAALFHTGIVLYADLTLYNSVVKLSCAYKYLKQLTP
jgi:hypothetical protein